VRVVVVEAPAAVVTVPEARSHLKLDEGDDDVFLTGAIAAATASLDGPDGWLGRALGVQTLEARLDHFGAQCGSAVRLRYPPIVDIVSVTYLDWNGTEQTLAAGAYELRGRDFALAWGQSWPSARAHPEAVRIRYRAGYAQIPAPIKQAILLMVGDLYRNRGTVTVGAVVAATPMSTTVENLLAPFRVFA